MGERGLWRFEAAADYLSIGRSHLYKLVASGELGSSVHIGRSARLPKDAIAGTSSG